MNKKLIVLLALLGLSMAPIVTLAGNVSLIPLPGLLPGFDFQVIANAIFGLLWPIFAAYSVIMFLLAGFLFLNAQGDISKVKDARNAVLWGTVGVAAGLLAFSIPFIIKGLLGV